MSLLLYATLGAKDRAPARDEGRPGLRDSGPNFYAACFRDLDGNKLAVVRKAPQ